jgi:hypothetical protein
MAAGIPIFDPPGGTGSNALAKLILDHQKKQKMLNAVLSDELAALWPLLTRGNPLTNWELYAPAALKLIKQYSLAAAAIGAAAFTAYRVLVVPTGYKFTPPAIEQPKDEQILRSLGWATRAVGDENTPETQSQAARTLVNGAAQRIVTDTARRALIGAVGEDQRAIGWYRVPSDPNACAFCRVMCIRSLDGILYQSEGTAGRYSDIGAGRKGKQFKGEGDFKFHDHCECTAVPLFEGQKPKLPSYVHDWDHDYTVATAGKDDPLNAFRRSVDNPDGFEAD